VCGINDPGHTCDEYLVLFTKSGLTLHAATPEPARDAWERVLHNEAAAYQR
jgi:hypothetical protein